MIPTWGGMSQERNAKLKFEVRVRVWYMSRRNILTERAASTKHRAMRHQGILRNYDIWLGGVVKFKVKNGRR